MKKLIYSIGGILFLFVFVRFIPLVFIGQAPICDKDLTKSNLSEYNQNEELAVLQLLNESRAEDFRYFFESFVEEKGKNATRNALQITTLLDAI